VAHVTTLLFRNHSTGCFFFLADFNQDGKPDNISFMVKRIKVHSMDALKDSSYRFPLNYGVEKFLELFSGMWNV
jgi:disintegrin and metalloproteinase domain-containing protein 10